MGHPDQRLSLHWRSNPHRQEMTEQERVFAQWLKDHTIPFRYEQLQLIKNNDLAGHDFSDGKKVKKKDVLRGIPDFVFTNGEQTFVIEVTERKRPSVKQKHPRLQDPKRRLRHLARLARLDCAVIYREELQLFFTIFHQIAQSVSATEKDSIQGQFNILHQTVKRWADIEWST
jgi:hypothetical protein